MGKIFSCYNKKCNKPLRIPTDMKIKFSCPHCGNKYYANYGEVKKMFISKKMTKKLVISVAFILLLFLIIFFLNNRNTKTTGTFTDSRDGKIYKTVKIGNQVWMAENFAFKTDSGCWTYNDNDSNISKYGYLYDFETAKKIAPKGWHLPTKEEFIILLDNYGGNGYAAYDSLLKKDKSNFNTHFAGMRIEDNFESKGEYTGFWSDTEIDEVSAWACHLIFNCKGAIVSNSGSKKYALSVRLIKD